MTSAASSPSISWRVYDGEHQLSSVLTDAARACVNARAANPCEFLLTYLAKVTRGDRVDELTCTPLLTPGRSADEDGVRRQSSAGVIAGDADGGLVVRVKLFTNAEGEVSVSRLPFTATPVPSTGEPPAETADAAPVPPPLPLLDAVAAAAAVRETVAGPLTAALKQIGVCAQARWDEALTACEFSFTAVGLPAPAGGETGSTVAAPSTSRGARTSSAANSGDGGVQGAGAAGAPPAGAAVPGSGALSVPCTVSLPVTVRLALSLAACVAAAKNLNRPLFRHVYAMGDVSTAAPQEAGAGVDTVMFSMPQLLLPLFGAAPGGAAPPAGCIAIHTLYLLPALSRERGGGGSAVMTAALMSRLAGVYRALQDRHSHLALRSDGAFVLESHENITDAVQAATEAAEAAGLVAGQDVFFGVRVQAPVVALGVVGGAGGSISAPAAGGGVGEVAGAAAAARKTGAAAKKSSGAGKAPGSNPEDCTYALFTGDPDVTGAQVAAYLQQQVAECEGRLVLLQDTHHPSDTVGLTRLRRRLARLGCALGATVGGETGRVDVGGGEGDLLGERTPPPQMHSAAVNVLEHGTLTALAATCGRLSREHQKEVALTVAPAEVSPLTAVVDLAVGLGVRYLSMGALTVSSACAALSHYHQVQESLRERRLLRPAEAPLGTTAEAIDEEEARLEEEDVIPEIKRKGDKKRKKGK